MSQPEAMNTMLHGSFVLVDAATKSYALRISGLTAGSGGVPIETSLPVAARATSKFANGQVTAPAAGATIAQTADLDPGTWDIEVRVHIGGTTVAAVESDNAQFKIGATPVATITCPVPGTTGAANNSVFKCRVDAPAPLPVSVAAAAAATAGAIYTVDIVATRVN